jgi:hypothetical protein
LYNAAPGAMLGTPEVNGVGQVWFWCWVAVALMLPALTMRVVLNLGALIDRAQSLRSRLRPRRAQRAQRAQVQPVERLAADLHRLAVHLDKIERSDEMHRAARLRAAALAYDDTLRSACRTLEVDVPEHTPLHAVERLETEAALAQRGLVW